MTDPDTELAREICGQKEISHRHPQPPKGEAMSEKNGEIAQTIEERNEFLRDNGIWWSAGELKDLVLKALDQKDRDYEALIGVLVEALRWYEDDKNWDQNSGAARSLHRQPNTVDGPGETIEEADMGYRAEQALSHPLVQEYLKKAGESDHAK